MDRQASVWLGVVSSAWLAACGDSGFCVEQEIHIPRGLYGHVTYATDVSSQTNPPVPRGNVAISVLDMPDGTIVATTASNSDGVFEIALADGNYALCEDVELPCVSFSISNAMPLMRADLHLGFGSYWLAASHSDCAE